MRDNKKFLTTENEGILNHPANFSVFFNEWYPSIVYYILRIVKDQQAAEDIALEALVVIWEKRSEFRNIKVARAYLYSTARNAALNWLRSQKRNEKRSMQLSPLINDQESFVLEDIVRAELLHELYSAINELPAQCRKIFDLLYVQGKNNREVAHELNLSVNTVKAQRARGLSLIRKKLSFLFAVFFSLL